jgi:tetratricopeptide (TPR) repeat protein
MKKIILILLVSIISTIGFSQSKNVQNSFNSFRQEKFAEAKHFIDLAYNNESTSNDPKMWNYRAKIYLEIMQKHTDIDANAVFSATEAHIRCLDRDKKGRIAVRKWTKEESILNGLVQCGYNLFNTAVEDYNSKDYHLSIKKNNEIFRIIPLDKDGILERGKIVPSSIYKNMFLAALQLDDVESQVEYLQKSIDNNTDDPIVYYYMSNIYSEKEELDRALEYIQQGKEKFSSEITLINAEIDLFLKMGKSPEEIIIKLSDAIDLDNTNEVLYIIRSQMYTQISDFVNAEIDLLEALEINSESSSANNNLASLYLSRTEPLVKERNDLSYRATKKINSLDKQIEDLQRKSLPYLKKYLQIKETEGEFDKAALNTLASIYYNLGMEKESTDTRNKLNSLK